jgi:predicted tellurium resistance membrane protein TerC
LVAWLSLPPKPPPTRGTVQTTWCAPTPSTRAAIFWIVVMNLVFSFDSILGAIALTDNIWIMGIAVVVSGILMMVMADKVASFLQKNRMYEVLGLFILFLVGVMLTSEGGHLMALKLGGSEIHKLSITTFYFVLAVLVVVDLVQARYQKKLDIERERNGEPAEA